MKILHLSDLHLGRSLNGYSLIEDQKYILNQILGLIDKYSITLVLIAGDVYDRAVPSAEAIMLLDWFINEISKRKIFLIAIPGNHDSAERLAYGSLQLMQQSIYFCPIFNGKITSIHLEDEFGPIIFWLIPFLKPSTLRPFFPNKEIGDDYTVALKTLIDSCNIDTGIRNIAISHQFVIDTHRNPLLSDSEFNIGGIDSVDVNIYNKFDYVALGHLHKPQKISKNTIRYAGSPLKYSLSEATCEKSAIVIDIKNKNSIKITSHPLKPKRDVRIIKGLLDNLLDPKYYKEANTDDYVYAIITDNVMPLDCLGQLRKIYPNILSLEKSCNTHSKNQNQIENTRNVYNQNPVDTFSRFFAAQNGRELTKNEKGVVEKTFSNALNLHETNRNETN